MNLNMVETPRSSCVAAVGYDEGTKILGIVFKHGGKYTFTGVPKDLYDGMLKAPSVGKYFHSRIEGHYPFNKVT